jgi:prefoldin beta subunit
MAEQNNNKNPMDSLDQETQAQIQELQMLEHSFQQLLMQKNAFSMELNETELIIKEVEKTTGEVSRIIGQQVVIKSTKEDILQDMNKKQDLIKTRMETIDKQEKEFSEKIEALREQVMKKFQQ